MKKVLHVGCGTARVPPHIFAEGEWQEVRLDVDPAVEPDIVASITAMPVADASVYAVMSCHNLEHLAPHDVPVALEEFRRVLAPKGFAWIQVPDLQAAAALVAEGKGHETAYVAPCGNVTAMDMLFGHSGMSAGNPWMAHRCGFTLDTLHELMCAAGFVNVTVRAADFGLDAVGVKE